MADGNDIFVTRDVKARIEINSKTESSANKEQLIKEVLVLLHQKKLADAKLHKFNKDLYARCQTKRVKPFNEEVSIERYEELLSRFYRTFEQKKESDRKIVEKTTEVTQENSRAVLEMGQRRTELINEMSQTAKNINAPLRSLSALIEHFMITHDKLSTARCDLFATQNKFSELREKISKLENVGDGLKTIDFTLLEAEIQSISTDIDNKDVKIDVLQKRVKKEKEKFLETGEETDDLLNVIEEQTEIYEDLRTEENFLRCKVDEFRVEKMELNDEYNELSLKSGILNQIPLMRRFDELTDESERIFKEIFALNSLIEKCSVKAQSFNSKIEELVEKNSDPQALDGLMAREMEKLVKKTMKFG